MNKNDIINLLQSKDQELADLYKKADKIRQQNVQDTVHLRGIIEFSNYCIKQCNYCGINASAQKVTRYRIPHKEIIETCNFINQHQLGTVVLQSGEDPYYTSDKITKIIRDIKNNTDLAITLSIGNKTKKELQEYKAAGMDRYLIRFETSNSDLFNKCHPDDSLSSRVKTIQALQALNVQTGSGFLIGLPKQTIQQLAEDILFCTNLNLNMIGIGPYISNPNTVFTDQINPFDEELFYKVIAIIRILNPKAHIPATTAFDAINKNGRNLLLQRGANIFMPNMTPIKYKENYQLYPNKPCINETSNMCISCINKRLLKINRTVGTGRGDALN
jgi:biotin synthase